LALCHRFFYPNILKKSLLHSAAKVGKWSGERRAGNGV
jgi:hypothetical protein